MKRNVPSIYNSIFFHFFLSFTYLTIQAMSDEQLLIEQLPTSIYLNWVFKEVTNEKDPRYQTSERRFFPQLFDLAKKNKYCPATTLGFLYFGSWVCERTHKDMVNIILSYVKNTVVLSFFPLDNTFNKALFQYMNTIRLNKCEIFVEEMENIVSITCKPTVDQKISISPNKMVRKIQKYDNLSPDHDYRLKYVDNKSWYILQIKKPVNPLPFSDYTFISNLHYNIIDFSSNTYNFKNGYVMESDQKNYLCLQRRTNQNYPVVQLIILKSENPRDFLTKENNRLKQIRLKKTPYYKKIIR